MRLEKVKFGMLLLLAVFLFNISHFSLSPPVQAQETVSTVVSEPSSANWTLFWQVFKQHAMWRLQWYNETSGEWVTGNQYLTVQMDYPEPHKCKLTLIFDAPLAGDYQLLFGIDYRVKRYVQKLADHQYVLSYKGFNVTFDWSDIIGIAGLQLNHGVKTMNGARVFWFSIRRNNIPKGLHFELDPSVIASTTAFSLTSHQRKCFRANNYFWVFYYKKATGVDKLCYKSSSDGITWGSETDVFSGLWVWYDFDIYLENNTFIHMAYCDSSGFPTYVVNYTTGTLGAGTVSWGTHYTVASGDVDTPSVTLDTDGYPWVAYRHGNNGNVSKATYMNGSAWDTPSTLWTGTESDLSIVLSRQSSGKIYAVYRKGESGALFGRLYNGSDWESQQNVNTGSNPCRFYGYSVVVDDNWHIHVEWADYADGDLCYAWYNSTADDWSSHTYLNELFNYCGGISINSTSQDLYAWYHRSDIIYYRKKVDGIWQSETEAWNRTVQNVYDSSFNVYANASESYTGGFWLEGSSPYNIVHGALGVPDNSPTISSFEASSATVYANDWFHLYCTINDEDLGAKDSFTNATVEISNDVVLKWDNATDTFSIYSDVNGYASIDPPNCARTVVTSTSYRLDWKIRLNQTYPEGTVNVVADNTTVYDSVGFSGSNSQTDLFTLAYVQQESPGTPTTPPAPPSPPPSSPPSQLQPPVSPPSLPAPPVIPTVGPQFQFGVYILLAVVAVAVVAAFSRTKQPYTEKIRKGFKNKIKRGKQRKKVKDYFQ